MSAERYAVSIRSGERTIVTTDNYDVVLRRDHVSVR